MPDDNQDEMKVNKGFRKVIGKFILPIITISLFFLIRVYILDGRVYLQAFSLIAIFVVVFSAFGGFWSGLLSSLYATFLATYLYIQPLKSFSITQNTEVNRIIVFLFSCIIIALFTSAFANNRRQLKRAKIKLDKTTNRLRRIMDNIFTMVTIMDRNGIIYESNHSYAQSLGLKVNEVINRNIFDLEPWNDNPELQELLKQSLINVKEDSPIKFEHELLIGRDITYAEVTVNVINESKFEEIVLTVRDRTDKRNYENELLKSKEVLSRLIDANVIGMTVADLDGELIETNDQFLEMIGYTPQEFIDNGLSWEKITPEQYREIDQQKIIELKEKGYMNIFEKEYIHKDGHRIALAVAGVMINAEQVLCLMLDLTPQKQLQQKKDEFISVASHELKTPMTVIKGYLQLLSKKLEKSEVDYSDFLSIIDFQLNKMNTLVNELHDMSKIESNKLRVHLEEFNLNELIVNSIREVSPFIESHEIIFIEKRKDIRIDGDIIRLEQVLINLLTNAIKYSPDGGKIEVTIDTDSANAIVSVRDFGIGIADNNLKNIFTKFFQVEEKLDLKEGLGLGLYISSEIIKQHKGTISVESKQNEGSTFVITLPLKLVT